ncbi:hypothetical protein GMB80_14590 [Turicibacter sanguinis]|nr:hypothetical protein [Turicibacter sanguinis]
MRKKITVIYFIGVAIVGYILLGSYNFILNKVLFFTDNALIKNVILGLLYILIIDLVCIIKIVKNKEIIHKNKTYVLFFSLSFLLCMPYQVIYTTNYFYLSKWFNLGLFICALISLPLITSNIIYFLKENDKDDKQSVRNYWFYIIPLMAILITWINNYPGLMSFDSYYQLEQIKSGIYNDVHPAIHTIFTGFLLKIYDSPATAIVFQIVMLCGCIGYIFSYFNKKGISSSFLLSSVIIWSSLAPIQIYTCYLWKDILYTVGLLGITIIFIRIVTIIKLSYKELIILGILLTVVALFRHNGMVVYLISCLSLIVFIVKLKSLNYLMPIIISFLLILFIKGPFYDQFNVQSNDNGTKYAILAKSVVSVIANDGNYTQEELVKIEDIMPYDVIKRNYNWSQGHNLLWNINLDDAQYGFGETLGEKGRELISLFLSLFPKNHLIMIGDIIGSASLMWNFDFIRINFLSVHMVYFAPVIIGIILLIGYKDIVGLIPLIPFIFNIISILISNISYEARYAYPTIVLSLVCLIYIKLRIKQLSDI